MIRFNEEKQANEIALINIFESINGEAYAAGKPCVFIRTFGCNLRCIFCDTRECWTEKNLLKIYPERNKEADPFKWRTAEEIFNEVNEIEKNYLFKSICLTGGEPLMEENKDLNRIKVMLAEKKRTNKWLAEQLGVNAATVSKWCTNSSQPSLDMLSKIAAALKVDYTELVRIKRIHGEDE